VNPNETGLLGCTASPALELARLQWLLVVQGRRAWTTLSSAVLAGVGLALQSRAPAGLTSPLGLVFALAALTCCLLWLFVQHGIRQVERQIKREASEAAPSHLSPISVLSSSPSDEAAGALERQTGSRSPLPWPPLGAWLPPERAPRA
jgi:hypothetical protein